MKDFINNNKNNKMIVHFGLEPHLPASIYQIIITINLNILIVIYFIRINLCHRDMHEIYFTFTNNK